MLTDPKDLPAVLAYLDACAPVLWLTLDAEQQVVAVNAYARRVLGETVVGRPLRELLVDFTPAPELPAPNTRDERPQLLSFNTASGVPNSFTFRFIPLPAGWMALGSPDWEGESRLGQEVLALNRELTDLNRRLHQANAELRELNQLKNRFLGMAAHDLRRPVGLVMTYTDFLLDEAAAALRPEHREFLRTCRHAAADMQRLIDEFLSVAVIESGKLQLEVAPATAASLAAGALDLARMAAARKRVTVLLEPGVDVPELAVDTPKLQQALLNLLTNAVEHSQPGQRVWVSWRRQERQLVFAVRDEGPGLTAADQARLFQPFARAGTRKTAGERSVGLGLAIARQVVEAHQGQLRVESTPGQGATFFLALPLPAEPSATAAPPL